MKPSALFWFTTEGFSDYASNAYSMSVHPYVKLLGLKLNVDLKTFFFYPYLFVHPFYTFFPGKLFCLF